MKNIKTYEGFFDFLKKKKKSTEPIYLDDIKECFLDIMDNNDIRCSLSDGENIFEPIDHTSPFHNIADILKGDKNSMVVRIKYNNEPVDDDREIHSLSSISDEEVKRLLSIVISKLKTYNCSCKFYLSCGGKLYNNEYNLDKLFSVIDKLGFYINNITIKVTAPSEIIK